MGKYLKILEVIDATLILVSLSRTPYGLDARAYQGVVVR